MRVMGRALQWRFSSTIFLSCVGFTFCPRGSSQGDGSFSAEEIVSFRAGVPHTLFTADSIYFLCNFSWDCILYLDLCNSHIGMCTRAASVSCAKFSGS
jgi:hypothetical protein